ncbi:MAG: SWIM zinc finger family protein [Chloroflexota bacterium]|nr:SWIM zinc finger family protein [Chloroflexota bacterium]MDE2959790.1 SWIM zinc finger family protein [Chloroflexota bacterium]
MTNLPHLTEDDVRAKVTEQSYDRGVDYYHAGTVESATLRGNRLFAAVQGSEWDPYQVGITFSETDFTASCTCPYDWGGYCKHVVAALLTVSDDDSPIPVAVKPPVADLLDGLDADELRALVRVLVEVAPSLLDTVDAFCSGEPT